MNTAVKLSSRSRARTHSPNFGFLPSPFTARLQRTRFQPFSGEGWGSSNLHRALPNGRTQCEGKRAKAFTLFSLSLNHFGHTGEGVKAKNKNCLTRAHIRARVEPPCAVLRGLMPIRTRSQAERAMPSPTYSKRWKCQLHRRCCPMLGNETSRLLASTETSAAGQILISLISSLLNFLSPLFRICLHRSILSINR